MTCHDVARSIDAFIDDELTAGDASNVSRHIYACAACSGLLREREALRRLLQGLPYYGAPPAVRERVLRAQARTESRRFVWAAAAAVLIAVGAMSSLAWRRAAATSATADAVVARHVAALAAPRPFDVASSDQHTVKPWFQGKVDFAPPVVDLSASGFPLLGGRVDHVDGRPVAALAYQRRAHIIDVFIWPAGDRTSAASDARTVRGFHERHWTADGMAIWIVSDVNEEDLLAFERAFRGQPLTRS